MLNVMTSSRGTTVATVNFIGTLVEAYRTTPVNPRTKKKKKKESHRGPPSNYLIEDFLFKIAFPSPVFP